MTHNSNPSPHQVDSEPATTATTQLEELIASLQREKQPSTDSVDNTTDTNAIQVVTIVST